MREDIMSDYEYLMTSVDEDIFIPTVPSVLGAMLMSKVSRQKEGFREDLIKMVEKDMVNLPKVKMYDSFKSSYVVANGFMEKWGVNYGHSSIKELDTLQMCIERRSRWFTELLETVQASKFMSYIEYSLRYNPPRTYYTPMEFEAHPELLQAYKAFCDYCFDTYYGLKDDFVELFEKRYPEMSAKDIEIKAFENARNVLPLSTHANMGMQSNLRAFCDAVSELASYEGINDEIYSSAMKMKQEAEKVSVGMVRHAEKTAYLESFVRAFYEDEPSEKTRGERRDLGLKVGDELIGDVTRLAHLGDLSLMSRFDELPNVFKTLGRNVDVYMTEGCHHQFLRHRAFDFRPKMPSVDYGYINPLESRKGDQPEIEARIREKIALAYEKSCEVYDRIRAEGFKYLSPYVIINANARKVSFFANFYALSHFITLRREEHSQDEIRHIADALYKAFKKDEALYQGLRFDKNMK